MTPPRQSPAPAGVANTVRIRIARGRERLWRFEDFEGLPFMAVAQALSRLVRDGQIERLSKGTYYRARETALGRSKPNPAAIQRLASLRQPLFPAGLAAANLLGFTTQVPDRSELATSATSLPRKLIDPRAIIHTRRPHAWAGLSDPDAAFLDFLRCAGSTSELTPPETIRRTLKLLRERGRFGRLARIASTEPPRVRALLGALGERIPADRKSLRMIRGSLNPLSRFEFGQFSGLPNSRAWQAKLRSP